jgi:DNA-binding MarR family transcriptional regulator
MDTLIQTCEQYIHEVLGVKITAAPWMEAHRLPAYLREDYRFFRATLMNNKIVLMVGEHEQTPAVIDKQVTQVRDKSASEVVYVREALTSYNRQRLMEHKVSFVVPGNQMYLPTLGIDLREHFRRLRETRVLFSPATQAMILRGLNKRDLNVVTPKEMAMKLGYSPMTLTRAFDELEQAGIGKHGTRGKERLITFTVTGKALWEQVLPSLKSPVKKRLHVITGRRKLRGTLAGLSAMTEYTALAEPDNRVYAFGVDEWKTYQQEHKLQVVTMPEPGTTEIELWTYSPRLAQFHHLADRLSLYLSLKDTVDERVQAALDNLLGGVAW